MCNEIEEICLGDVWKENSFSGFFIGSCESRRFWGCVGRNPADCDDVLQYRSP